MSGRDLVVLTPEHVVVRLEPAGPGRRFLALLIDALAVTGGSVAVGLVASLFGPGIGQAASATAGLVLGLAWNLGFELRMRGQTPGKRAMGLRVVDVRGLPLQPTQAIIRNVTRVLDAAPVGYGLGVLVSVLDPWRRRLGDIAAATLVVREAELEPPRIELPDPRRYNSLDRPEVARRIRHRIGLEERELLLAACLRAPLLDEAARLALMEQVGAHYRTALGIDDPALSGEALVRALAAVVQGRTSRR